MPQTGKKKLKEDKLVPGAFDLACVPEDEWEAITDISAVVIKKRPVTVGRAAAVKSSKREAFEAGRGLGFARCGLNAVLLSEKSVPEVQGYIRAGFKAAEIQFTTGLVGLSQKALAGKLGLSSRTIQRKIKEDKRLSPEESDRLYRIQKVSSAVLALFEGRVESMQRWLKTPLPVLGGETPLAYSDTEPGAQFVLDLINRLEHGVFS